MPIMFRRSRPRSSAARHDQEAYLPRRSRRLLVPAVCVVAAAVFAPASAFADAGSNRYEQYRYSLETINLTYSQFVARENDFRANGCVKGPAGCRKPSPYNAFDWTDDGCSGRDTPVLGPLSNVYRNLFNQPCRLHDFGYRNFGKGLALYRNEAMRLTIDNRFKAEMSRLCNEKYSGWTRAVNRAACQAEASAAYAVVRNRGGNWGTSGSPPPHPDNCPGGDLSGSSTDGTCGTSSPAQDNCPSGDFSGSSTDGTCGSPPPAASIQLSRGAPATYGYWYSVYLSGFAPGSQVTLTCRDSVDPGGFWTQTFSIDAGGHAGDSTLCYSGDHPDHWVTASNGAQSNHLVW